MQAMTYSILSIVGRTEFMNDRFMKKEVQLIKPVYVDTDELRNIIRSEFPSALKTSRTKDVIAIRCSVINILYEYKHILGISLLKLGKVFHKDHSTIIHAIKVVRKWHEVPSYEKELETYAVVRKVMVKHINALTAKTIG